MSIVNAPKLHIIYIINILIIITCQSLYKYRPPPLSPGPVAPHLALLSRSYLAVQQLSTMICIRPPANSPKGHSKRILNGNLILANLAFLMYKIGARI